MPRSGEPGRRMIYVGIDVGLADWLDQYAHDHGYGREIVVEDALRAKRSVVERDRRNPRPMQKENP